MSPFKGQTAIVTGAGAGIGYEVCRQLAAAGANVVLNDISEPVAEQAVQQLAAETGTCVPWVGDVAQVETTHNLVNFAVQKFGQVNLVVSNAGLTSWGDFFDYKPEAFERVINVNLRGSFFLAQAAARQMRAQRTGGRIVFTSSVTGRQAVRYLAAYGMTKAGLEMLARNLVLELSPYGITINAVAPGSVLTPRNLADDTNYEENWGNLMPTGTIVMPEDIAHAVLFLLSPQARQITGQTIVVDGGWTVTSPTPPMEDVKNTNQE